MRWGWRKTLNRRLSSVEQGQHCKNCLFVANSAPRCVSTSYVQVLQRLGREAQSINSPLWTRPCTTELPRSKRLLSTICVNLMV